MTNAEFDLSMMEESCVKYAHDAMLKKYGGLPGVRDENVLGSALLRAMMRLHYDEKADIFDLASEVGYGILRNHPFNDANKRTGAVVVLTTLRANGYDLRKTVTNEKLIKFFEDVAAGATEGDKEYMADFLRKNSYKMGAQQYVRETASLRARLLSRMARR